MWFIHPNPIQSLKSVSNLKTLHEFGSTKLSAKLRILPASLEIRCGVERILDIQILGQVRLERTLDTMNLFYSLSL
jgi:hypothetical protein